MYRARLTQKAGAKKLEYTIGLHQRTPEAMGSGAVVGSVGVVLRKADGVRHLVRHLVDDHRDADAVEQIDQAVMKVGNRLRLEWELPGIAAAGAATRRWLMKSSSISRISLPTGIGDVPSPAAVT